MRGDPPASLRTVTTAFGMPFPVTSVTAPEIVPDCCAIALPTKRRTAHTQLINCILQFLQTKISPRVSLGYRRCVTNKLRQSYKLQFRSKGVGPRGLHGEVPADAVKSVCKLA